MNKPSELKHFQLLEEPTELEFEIEVHNIIFRSRPSQIVIVKDVTKAMQRAEADTKEKLSDIMIATTSHDMRTPLNAMKNSLELLKEKPAIREADGDTQ